MAAHQALPSLGFSRQEHWSGLPFPSPIHESEKWKWSRSVMSDSLWPHHCSLPGSSVHGIFQARILEWVAIAFSKSAWAVITKYYRLGDLIKSLFSHTSRDRKSKIKASAEWVSVWRVSSACRWPPSPCVCTQHFSVHMWKERETSSVSSSPKDISLCGLEPTSMTLFNLNYL